MTPPAIGDAAAPRPAFEPALLCVDLDGTCLDEEQHLHPRIESAVRSAAERIPVVVATGRMYRSGAPWAERLGSRGPLVCYQGAIVQELPNGSASGAVLSQTLLAGDTALVALEVARAHGWHRQTYANDRLVCEQKRPEAKEYAEIADVGIDFVDDLTPFLTQGTAKFMCVVDGESAAALCEETLRSAVAPRARVVRSLPQFVEVTDPAATKSNGLRAVCAHLGVDIGHTVAIGDAPNDTDMLLAAGFAVAVAGAREAVLAAADCTCAAPAQAGVADVVEALGIR